MGRQSASCWWIKSGGICAEQGAPVMLVAGTCIHHNVGNLIRMSRTMPPGGVLLIPSARDMIGTTRPTTLERACIEFMSRKPWLLVLIDALIPERIAGLALTERPEISGGSVHTLSSNIVLLQHGCIYTIQSRPVIALQSRGRVPDPSANLDRPIIISNDCNNHLRSLLGETPQEGNALDDALAQYAPLYATWLVGSRAFEKPIRDKAARVVYYGLAHSGQPKLYRL